NAVWTATESRWERRLERSCIANRLAGFGLECGFPAAVLLPAVAVVVAGRDQGGVSRTGEHRRQLRSRGTQPDPRDEAAQRGLAQDLRQTVYSSGLHALQRLFARSLFLPILRRARRSHLRSSIAALARRTHGLEQRRRRVLAVQSAQGQYDARGIEDVAVAAAVPAERAASAP